MPIFGKRSERILETVHDDLRRLAIACIPLMDFSVSDGFRGEDQQNAAYQAGLSKLEWPDSWHNRVPSRAVHFNPWPVDWHNSKRWYHLAGIVRARADAIGIAVRWGGDWDGDFDLDDQRFMDLAHYELRGQQ